MCSVCKEDGLPSRFFYKPPPNFWLQTTFIWLTSRSFGQGSAATPCLSSMQHQCWGLESPWRSLTGLEWVLLLVGPLASNAHVASPRGLSICTRWVLRTSDPSETRGTGRSQVTSFSLSRCHMASSACSICYINNKPTQFLFFFFFAYPVSRGREIVSTSYRGMCHVPSSSGRVFLRRSICHIKWIKVLAPS